MPVFMKASFGSWMMASSQSFSRMYWRILLGPLSASPENKPEYRNGKVILIDASHCCEARRKSIGTKRNDITDACRELHGRFIRRGETLWKGAIVTGDFIFVNRWKWNFVQPRNNEVMIFSTTGIDQLPQGTHYIKRMKARPGETYSLEHPVDGRPREVTMGDDEYFACGDNYNNSFDSRYWGTVPRGNLRGVASVVFWPFNGWRIIK